MRGPGRVIQVKTVLGLHLDFASGRLVAKIKVSFLWRQIQQSFAQLRKGLTVIFFQISICVRLG